MKLKDIITSPVFVVAVLSLAAWSAITYTEAEMKFGAAFKDCPDCPEMVTLPKRLAIGKTEVTQGQWKAIMGNNPSHFQNCGDTCPVEQVSWDDANEFIKKLNAKTGKKYRLPSDSEWEYACQGRGKTEYCGGKDLDAVGWHDLNSGWTTHPVGGKKANGYGLYDMSGNVGEWTNDCGGKECTDHAVRGGTWANDKNVAGVAHRGVLGSAIRLNSIGFRVAMTLP